MKTKHRLRLWVVSVSGRVRVVPETESSELLKHKMERLVLGTDAQSSILNSGCMFHRMRVALTHYRTHVLVVTATFFFFVQLLELHFTRSQTPHVALQCHLVVIH